MANLFVSIHIDMEAISRLQLEITLESISDAIKNAPKLKIKPGVSISLIPSLGIILMKASSTANCRQS